MQGSTKRKGNKPSKRRRAVETLQTKPEKSSGAKAYERGLREKSRAEAALHERLNSA